MNTLFGLIAPGQWLSWRCHVASRHPFQSASFVSTCRCARCCHGQKLFLAIFEAEGDA